MPCHHTRFFLLRERPSAAFQQSFPLEIWNELLAGHIPEIDMRDVPEEVKT
jgi:hypothetical protein